MQKEIIEINKEKGIYRVTTLNERWYTQQVLNEETGLPEFIFFPSSTWIASYYPKGIQFYKWLAEKGWDESEAIKNAAGDKGSKVHYACGDIDLGKSIDIINSKYLNPSSGQPESLTMEEVDCILSYRDFIEEYKPILLANEISGFGTFYAGTIDKIFKVKDEIWILDIKTSKSVWEEMKLQISSYSHMNIDYQKLGITDDQWNNRKLFILQVGYRLNKAGYKLTEILDKYDLFLTAYKLWQNENHNAEPKEASYPLFISSPFRQNVNIELDKPFRNEPIEALRDRLEYEKKVGKIKIKTK